MYSVDNEGCLAADGAKRSYFLQKCMKVASL